MMILRYCSRMWLAANEFYRSELERIDRNRKWLAEGINDEPFESYPFRFTVNQMVQKRSGYKYPGVVVVRWTTRQGRPRYVVEADNPDFDGMFHIFSEEQLEPRD